MFLEREGELGQLRAVLSELAVSGGKVVLVRGEAGIGKSTLIREFLDAVGGAAHLHLGFCDDLQTPQPYGPLWDMGRSEPELRRSLEARDRQRVLEGFFAMLALTLRPNVVVIEDIQWSDEATLDAVKYVGRRIARANGLLVLTYRDGEVDDYHPLRRVIGDLAPGTVVRIELGGLSYESVSSIVGSSDLDPQRVFEETRGNPFLATEMALAGTDGVPASVRDSVRARLGKLSRSAQRAVKVLSVIPRRVSLADVTAFTGASLRELAEGERVGLLEVGDEMVSFRHDLIRRAIEASLTISESVGIHRALLDVIPAEADPALLVYHASQGADITRLLALGPEAAEAAKAVGSNREAAAHFRALSPHLGRLALDRRAQVLRDWALVELYLENAAAMEILDRAIELQRDFGTDQSLAAVLVLGVDVNRTFGRFATAKENAAEAVAILDRYEPSAELASALAAHAWLLIHLGHIGLAEAYADRALAIAEARGAESAQIDALEARGILLYVRGQPGGLDLLEDLRKRARDGGHRYEEVSALLRMASVALEILDIDRALDFSAQTHNTAARYELPLVETEGMALEAEALAWSGRWTQAENLATELLGRDSRKHLRLGALVGAVRNRTGQTGAEELLEEAWATAEESDEVDHLLFAAAAAAESMWIHDRPDSDKLARFRQLVERGLESEYPWPAGHLSFWLWMSDALGEVPPGLPTPYLDLFSGRIESAANFWASRRIPYSRALALWSGEAEQRVEALGLLEGLGASAVAAKLRRKLRSEGLSLPRGKGKATRSSLAGLTARQAEVLHLLAAGLSNAEIGDRLFVSPRTVETHVSAILAKLGCSTRDGAVATARQRGVLAT